jgi:hypothetical protein
MRARLRSSKRVLLSLPIVALLLDIALSSCLTAAPVLGPWLPLFKGIDHASGTNKPDASNPDLSVINVVRVDLTDPDVQFLSTPRIGSYSENVRETGGITVSRFLQVHNAKVAINANFFDPQDYYLPEGTPMDVRGLAVSGGIVVSPQEGAANSAVLAIGAGNKASVILTNWPAHSTAGIQTAVAGEYPIVVNGSNIGRQYLNLPGVIHGVNPRTAFGLSADRRYLFLATIDGRQPGYSDGTLDYETGNWLLKIGVADGINMDGGGSSTLAIENSLGKPIRLNHPSAVADSGKERTVGSHLAVFAKPIPSFISGVQVYPDDVAASITWATADPALSWIEYGLTTDLGTRSATPNVAGVSHGAVLSGLVENTPYFYRLVASNSVTSFSTPIYTFTTTNYNALTAIFNLTNSWSYTSEPQRSQTWTTREFDDSSWSGPSPGLLWIDVRAAGPDPAVQPKGTQLPADPSNSGYPFLTYYFRTRFNIDNANLEQSLHCDSFIDDGAIVYLNGLEVYRLRMDSGSGITASTLATGYPCSGDATCVDSSELDSTALVNGDNVLAVEVHNYNARSADITFGLSLSAVGAQVPFPHLESTRSGESVRLDWSRGGFVLQEADSLAGPWTDALGPVVIGPYSVNASRSEHYFRLNR